MSADGSDQTQGHDAGTGVVHELRYTFDRQFIYNSLKRDHLWKGLILVGTLIGLFAVALLVGVFGAKAAGSVGAWAIVTLVCAIAALSRYWRFRRAVDSSYELWIRQSPSNEIVFQVDRETLTVIVDRARQAYDWGDLRRLWRYPDVWLFEIVKDRSIIFPPEAADEEMKHFIVERCRESGLRT